MKASQSHINSFIQVALFSGVCLLLFSCVSNKRIVYLQDHSQHHPHNYLADTSFHNKPGSFDLQPNDVISVRINHVQLTRAYTVVSEGKDEQRSPQQHPYLNGFIIDEAGMIDLPTMGKMKVSGLSVFEAQEAIAAAADNYFSDPSVRVFLLNFYVTVLGEVKNPGRYPVYTNQVNIFEALGMTGDAGEYADRESVKLLRNRADQNHLTHVDLTDQGLLASGYFFLQPNDVLMVKPQKRKRLANRSLQGFYGGIGALVAIATLVVLVTK